MPNLTSVSNVKPWITPVTNPATSLDDALLLRLIASYSAQIMTYISRPTFFKNAARQVTTGKGGNSLLLNQWPVISITDLLINNVSIPAAADPTDSGYLLEPWDGLSPGSPQLLQLNGYSFSGPGGYPAQYAGGGSPFNDGFSRSIQGAPAAQNVDVNFVTGYFVTQEAATIPATPYKLYTANDLGTWGQDDGVIFSATGVALTRVTGTPTTGQYAVSSAAATQGQYTFAAADTLLGVKISYSYIPPIIEQACIELVGEAYAYKERIGQVSKSLGGQTTASYMVKGLPDRVKEILNPFKRTMIQR